MRASFNKTDNPPALNWWAMNIDFDKQLIGPMYKLRKRFGKLRERELVKLALKCLKKI